MKIPGLLNVPDEVFESCNAEPIRTPGSVQSHGALLAFSASTGRLCYASENIGDFLSLTIAELSSFSFEDFAGSFSNNEKILDQVLASLARCPSQRVPLKLPGRLRFFDVEGHLSIDNHLVLELEKTAIQQQFDNLLSVQTVDFIRMNKTLLALESNRTFQDALESIAVHVREITRYDRVMIYRFDELGHGQVLVDNRREDLESFLGLHYPASDIPKQARELYLVSRVRQLVDTQAGQSRIIAFDKNNCDQQALDMSFCNLRSVSPVHIQYLENMGVRATLVISVILDGKLWGLIVCHHVTPKQVKSEVRLQCDLLSHVLSAAIESEERRQHEQAAIESQACYQQIESAVCSSLEWKDHLFNRTSVLKELLRADGVAWVFDGKETSLGKVPSSMAVQAICSRMLGKQIHETETTQTLSGWSPDDDGEQQLAGYAAIVVSKSPASVLIWFREGQSQSINWGGNPRKEFELLGDSLQLSPRKSFQRWCQELANTCLPWSEQDLLRAKAVGLFFGVKQVEDANRSKSQFLANMSHEIRTPMTAILGYTDILMDQLSERNDACREAVETIYRNGNHLLSILNDLLDLAKIEAGKLAINVSEIEIHSFLSETINLVAANAGKKNIELIASHSPSLPIRISSDPVRLRQILLNLLSNAIKFTSKGTVTIRTDYRTTENSDKDRLVFEVQDTGIGMSVEILSKLFQQFEQGDGTITRIHGGTGLGLVISRHLAESMGGTLTATSEPGIGSTFTAELAVKRIGTSVKGNEDSVSADHEPSTGNTQASKTVSPKTEYQNLCGKYAGLKILVAEEGPDNQRLIQWLLQKKMNANVTVVENGLIAIEAAIAAELNQPFQLILMDMQMPELDGLSATRRLRSLHYSKPVIALTAHASMLDRTMSLEAGCDQHICKPIVWDELYKAIDLVMESNQTKRLT